MKHKPQAGFAGMIILLGLAVMIGTGYVLLSNTDLPKIELPKYPTTNQNQMYPIDNATIPPVVPDTNIPISSNPNLPISPFVLEPLTITLTDTQFTQFVNTYKPADLPVEDITFTFSDNTITATTIASSKIVQGPIKVIAVHENKWFKITKVYVGTFELPPALTTQINSLVNSNLNRVLANMYLDGLQIESIKGNTMKLSLNAPKGYVEKNGGTVTLDKDVVGQ